MAGTRARITRNPERTRSRILEAATSTFSDDGFAGATVESISDQAGVNMRMIYHYFGDKAGLYVAVLESILADLRKAERSYRTDGGPAIDGLLGMFDLIYRHFGEHPNLVRILATENIMFARFLKSSVAVPAVASPSLENIRILLEKGRKDGSIRRQVDPLHLYVSMVSLALLHRSNGYTLSHIWNTDINAPDWQTEHHHFAREMIGAFLRSG